MNKKNVVYLHNGILFDNKNKVLIHAVTRMNLKNGILSEWKKKVTKGHILFYLYEMSGMGKSLEIGIKFVVAIGRVLAANKHGVSPGVMKMLSNSIMMMSVIIL